MYLSMSFSNTFHRAFSSASHLFILRLLLSMDIFIPLCTIPHSFPLCSDWTGKLFKWSKCVQKTQIKSYWTGFWHTIKQIYRKCMFLNSVFYCLKPTGVFCCLFCFKAIEKLAIILFQWKQKLTSFWGGYLQRKYSRHQKKMTHE